MNSHNTIKMRNDAYFMITTMAEHGFARFFQTRDPDDLPYENEAWNAIHNLGIYTGRGCTKFVFWDKDRMDYVFKIPFANMNEDYCNSEVEVYNSAIDAGVADCFAWCAYLDTFDHGMVTVRHEVWHDEDGGFEEVVVDTIHSLMPIYAMEFADVDEEGIASTSESIQRALHQQGIKDRGEYDTCDHADEDEDYGDYDDYMVDGDSIEGVEYVMRDQWGEALFNKFDEFCSDNQVNDLHAANVGFVDGHFVCVDYSGYRG